MRCQFARILPPRCSISSAPEVHSQDWSDPAANFGDLRAISPCDNRGIGRQLGRIRGRGDVDPAAR